MLDRKGSEVFKNRNLLGIVWDQADAQEIFSLFHCIFLLIFGLRVYLNGVWVSGNLVPNLSVNVLPIILPLQKQLENQ